MVKTIYFDLQPAFSVICNRRRGIRLEHKTHEAAALTVSFLANANKVITRNCSIWYSILKITLREGEEENGCLEKVGRSVIVADT
jgi:hypothetical protein